MSIVNRGWLVALVCIAAVAEGCANPTASRLRSTAPRLPAPARRRQATSSIRRRSTTSEQAARDLNGRQTRRSLRDDDDVDHADFLARADILAALGLDVLISRFEPYYEVAEYLFRYTDRPIGIAAGVPSVRQIADERYYSGLPGGVLESAGRCSSAR